MRFERAPVLHSLWMLSASCAAPVPSEFTPDQQVHSSGDF